jgi:cob(I)alamin adenosyltransferase
MLKKGLVQIYTGNGKGKTTAAVGLTVRAAGAGCNVLFYQFLKPAGMETGERKILDSLPNVAVKTLSVDWDLNKSLKDPETRALTREEVKKALAEITAAAEKKDYNVIILDEIVYCISYELANKEDICELLDGRDEKVEIVMTGRGAPEWLIEKADLVTEMKMIKHPYENGIQARKAIEF